MRGHRHTSGPCPAGRRRSRRTRPGRSGRPAPAAQHHSALYSAEISVRRCAVAQRCRPRAPSDGAHSVAWLLSSEIMARRPLETPAGRRRDLTQPPVCAPAEVCTPMAHPTCPRAAPQAPALATAGAPTPLAAPWPGGTADTRSTAPDAGASPSASTPGDGRFDAERATTREPTSSGACGTRRRVSACRLASSRPARQRALHVRARPPHL